MSNKYKNSSDVPVDELIGRLTELSEAVIGGPSSMASEFTMRVPAECDRDADIVIAEAAIRLEALRKYSEELQDQIRKMRGVL